jgi:hypothetical protein
MDWIRACDLDLILNDKPVIIEAIGSDIVAHILLQKYEGKYEKT